MPRRPQIAVVGHGGSACTGAHAEAAYEVGAAVARAGAVLVCGGLGGVMEHACRGASGAGGLAVGVLPGEDAAAANAYCGVVVPTGLGYTRNFVNALCADAMVVIGGGVGTASEVCAAYMHGRPVVALAGTGGAADEYAGRHLDHRGAGRVAAARTPGEAAREALRLARAYIESSSGSGS